MMAGKRNPAMKAGKRKNIDNEDWGKEKYPAINT